MAAATMSDVFKYFADKQDSEDKGNGYTMAQFRTDWSSLTDQDKADLKQGIGNGTLTY